MKIDFRVPKMTVFFTAFISILFFASCTKEVSFENGGVPGETTPGSVGGTALFTLSGSAGSTCPNVIINGTYKASASLTAANTVTIEVDVDSIGSYSIVSSVVDGVSFSGVGVFSTTGIHNITLVGTGTPAVAGTFNFSFGNNTCGLDIIVEAATPVEALFLLGGNPGACSDFITNGTYSASQALTTTNTISINVTVTRLGTYNIISSLANGIRFENSGTFTTLGSQALLLNGTGTPIASGLFDYTIAAGSQCNFSIATLPAGPVASGTLDCAGITKAGVYAQGVSLDGTNLVTIPVTVTTAGAYYIITTATNGVTFSGSGVLAAGAQSIVLTGSGVPANNGATIFGISFGGSTCNFTITF